MPPQIISQNLIFISLSTLSSSKSFDAIIKEYYVTVSVYVVHLSTMLFPSVDIKADSGGANFILIHDSLRYQRSRSRLRDIGMTAESVIVLASASFHCPRLVQSYDRVGWRLDTKSVSNTETPI